MDNLLSCIEMSSVSSLSITVGAEISLAVVATISFVFD
jgi:hypothetical protein